MPRVRRSEVSSDTQPQHDLIRAQARYFDIGFSNRDFAARCAFLEYVSRTLGRGRLESFLEVFCGPGHHVREMAHRGVRSYGVDPSAEMIAYTEEQLADAADAQGAADALQATAEGNDSVGEGLRISLMRGDPRDFSIPEAVDLAICTNYSFHYLLRNSDVIAHLVAMAKNLGRGGLYVMELEHPGGFLGHAARRRDEWVVERGGTAVKVRVGGGREAIDPVTQLRDREIAMEIAENGEKWAVRDSAPMRVFAHQELRALVRLAGVFDWVATFGDLSITQPFDGSAGACSMVPILRCSM
jgi:SAM-dependent methyltransferase